MTTYSLPDAVDRDPIVKLEISYWAVSGVDREERFSEDADPRLEHMDKALKLLGDAQARVSTAVDLSHKEYGNGYGVHVSVALSCDQKDEKLQQALDLAMSIAHEAASDHMDAASSLYDELT